MMEYSAGAMLVSILFIVRASPRLGSSFEVDWHVFNATMHACFWSGERVRKEGFSRNSFKAFVGVGFLVIWIERPIV
jgi:hypothetical protein